MKNRNEISGAYPLKDGHVYVSPEVETVNLQVQEIIAASGDPDVTVTDPWNGLVEEIW